MTMIFLRSALLFIEIKKNKIYNEPRGIWSSNSSNDQVHKIGGRGKSLINPRGSQTKIVKR